MNNKPIYTFKVDFEKCQVLDADFVSFLDKCLKSKINFDISLMDVNGMGYVPLNMAINLYIEDCKKEKKERCAANPYRDEYFGEFVKEFVEDLLLYFYHRTEMMNDNNYYQFVVYKGNYNFKVFIPKKEIDKETFDEYFGLGADYLMGAKGMNDKVLFHYVLPSFFINLIYDDLEKDENYLRLQDYRVDLA